MLLHESLAELARDHGHALFHDAAAFRGSLDDYLDERQASSGTINLLTDAVRLGALDALVTMLDSGANAADAVESAGQRLARDRGSADVRGCQWAVSVLGFALGRVPEALVAGLDPDAGTAAPPSYGPAGTAPAPGMSPVRPPQQPIVSPAAPIQSPPQPPQQPIASPATPFPPAGQQPVASPTPSYPGGGYGAGAPSYSSWAQPGEPKKRKTGLIITAVVVAIAVVVGGVFGIVALTGDDKKPEKDAKDKESSKTDEKTFDGPTIEGTGYQVTVPKGWTDDTDDYKAQTTDNTGTIDRIIVWGDSVQTARASIFIETEPALGETDPNKKEDTWINAMTGGDSSIETADLDDIDIDGLTAIGVEMHRVNNNGAELTQVGRLAISDDTVYSIGILVRDGDDSTLETFQDMLENSWTWED